MQKKAYFHSPFSEKTITEGNNRSLLLQFILSEVFSFVSAPKQLLSSPYAAPDEAPFFLHHIYEDLSLHKIQEHTSLLPLAFEKLSDENSAFVHSLSNVVHLLYNHSKFPKTGTEELEELKKTLVTYLKQLFFLLRPFIKECKADGGLILFLLRHQKEVALLSDNSALATLLKEMHLGKGRSLQDELCDDFHKRGFAYLIPEIKSLIESL